MKKHERLAQRLFAKRWFPNTKQDVSLQHLEPEDILVLVDRRTCERRDREWQGFRNYLYGYDCKILAECAAPGYAIMLIDASRDLQSPLAREFFWITQARQVKNGTGDNSPEMLAMIERHADPAQRHSIWGQVVVENGKPIGLYFDGEIVRQPVTKHWTEA